MYNLKKGSKQQSKIYNLPIANYVQQSLNSSTNIIEKDIVSTIENVLDNLPAL